MGNQRGFTLIEMAIVLAVVGLLVGGGLVAIGPLQERARQNQTNANLDQIESALLLFVIRNNRLPCPAFGSTPNTAAAYGLEQSATPGTTDCSLSGNGLTDSVVPWRTLGLDERYSVDGWGNRISYFPASRSLLPTIPSPSLTITNCLLRNVTITQPTPRPTTCDPADKSGLEISAPATDIPPLTQISPTVPSYPWGDYLPVYSINGAAVGTELTTTYPAVKITNYGAPNFNQAGLRAAYVLISHGRSGWYGWNKGSHQITAPGAVNYYTFKSANSAGSASGRGFIQNTPVGSWPPGANRSYFDDIVRWRSPATIIQLCGSGACGNP